MLDRLNKNLFHLGKALWSEIPGGSLVAALYDANEDLLLGKIDEAAKAAGLTNEDREAIGKLVGKMEQKIVDEADDIKATVLGELARIEKSILSAIEASTDVTVQAALREQLDALKKTRENWIQRLSETQRQLLGLCPKKQEDAIARRSLIARAQQSFGKLASARHEEMNFRLHELRWVGLIDRERRDDDWYYWQVVGNRGNEGMSSVD